MTKFGEEVRFSSECLTKFFCLPVTWDGSTYLINTGRNSISSVQANNHKLLKTWTLTHPHSFTTPVAFCSADNSLLCAMDNEILMTWYHEAEDLRSASKIKMNCSIFAILPVENICSVIIFTNGSISTMTNSASVCSTVEDNSSILQPGEELMWADAALSSQDVAIVYLTKNNKTQEYRLQSFMMENSSSIIKSHFSQSLMRSSVSLKCWCLRTGDVSLSLLTVWSDGEVHSFALDEAKSQCLFTMVSICSESAISISLINNLHLAILKLPTPSAKAILEIWDLKYLVPKASKELEHRISKHMQMKAFQSSVLLSSSEGIIMVPFQLEASTLSSALGKCIPSSKVSCPKSFVWSPDGNLIVGDPTSSEAENPTVYNSSISAMTSEKFGEMISKLSVDETKQFSTELAKRKDIKEEELVKILQMSLSLINAKETDEEKTSCANILLNGIFRISFSDIFLTEYLNILSFEEVVISLHFLNGLFKSTLFCGKTNEKPSYMQIIRWMELLFHSHYEAFVLSKDKKILELLQDIQHSFLEKMEIYAELEEIDNMLKIIRRQKQKHILPEKFVNVKYCIETLFI